MAQRFYTINVVTPAGTAQASPLTTTWQLEDNTLTQLEIDIPDGHCGYTGIRVLRSQQQVISWANASYLIANGRLITVADGDELTESKLVIMTYNVDVWDHTFYLRATIADMPAAGASTSATLPMVAATDITPVDVSSDVTTGVTDATQPVTIRSSPLRGTTVSMDVSA